MSPVPGSTVRCRARNCGADCMVGQEVDFLPTAVPASEVTGDKKSRGWYCAPCAERLGVKQ